MKDKIKSYRSLTLILLAACLLMGVLGWFLLPQTCLAPFTDPSATDSGLDKTVAVISMVAVGLVFDAAFYFTKGKRVLFLISAAELVLFACLIINNL